jgi:hypothetical protein
MDAVDSTSALMRGDPGFSPRNDAATGMEGLEVYS